MKQIVVFIMVSSLVDMVSAQLKEGTIIFEQKIDMHRRIPEEDAQMRSMIPHFRTSKFELVFADDQSYYKMQEAEPDITESTGGGGGIVMKFGGGNSEYYRNFKTNKTVEKRELADKDYIIEDTLHTIKWKMSEDTKMILGYNCKKAAGKTERGSDLEVWYTEDIALSSGPEIFTGLPGMVLMVDVNKGEFVYSAIEVNKTLDKKTLKAPSKGKRVSPAEFTILQKEIFGDQRGPVRIRRN